MTRTRRSTRLLALVAGATLSLGLSAGAAHAFWAPPDLQIDPCDLNPELCVPDWPHDDLPEIDPCLVAPEICDQLTTPTTDPTPDPDPEPETPDTTPEPTDTGDPVPTATPTVVVAAPSFTG